MAKKNKVGQAGNPAKPKKIIVKDRKDFLNIKKFLCEKGDFFEYTSSGSINTIIHGAKEFVSVDVNEAGGHGHHLNKAFRKDIDAWIAANKDNLKPWGPDYKEQLFNLGAIEKVIGEPGVAIDIDDCYWNHTYKLKYITEETFIKGLKRREWKRGRNACIGSLRKTKTVVPYFKGKPNYKLKNPIKSPKEYYWIRNHIIGDIYRMFFRLYEEIGDDFHMFLTDCVFTTYKNKKYVEDFLAKHGHKVKSKPIEFVSVDRKLKKVVWHDFTAIKRDKTGKQIATGTDKYYLYSNHQLIEGVAERSIQENLANINKPNENFLTENQ